MSIGFTTTESASRKTILSYSVSFHSSSLQKLSTGSWKAGLLPLLKGAARCSASRLCRSLERVGDGRLADRHDAAAFALELVEMLGLSRRQHQERRPVPVQRASA